MSLTLSCYLVGFVSFSVTPSTFLSTSPSPLDAGFELSIVVVSFLPHLAVANHSTAIVIKVELLAEAQ